MILYASSEFVVLVHFNMPTPHSSGGKSIRSVFEFRVFGLKGVSFRDVMYTRPCHYDIHELYTKNEKPLGEPAGSLKFLRRNNMPNARTRQHCREASSPSARARVCSADKIRWLC